jgi:WD40 repeat protein
MYKNKKILAIVPARKGSKGIKNKNLKRIQKRSLIEITANILKKVKTDRLISSANDNSIKVWDIRKNALLYRMKGHIDCPTGLSLSPDGSYVASNAMDNTGKNL